MRKVLLVLMILISNSLFSQNGVWEFLEIPKGDVDMKTLNFKKTENGILLVGAFANSVEMNGITLQNASGMAVFVAHYNQQGLPLSLNSIVNSNGFSNNFRIDLFVSDSNFYYIGLNFYGSLNYENHSIQSAGDYDIALLRVNRQDSVLWCKRMGGSGPDGFSLSKSNLAKGPNQELLVGGLFSDVFNIDTFSVNATNGSAFLLSLDSSANVQWIRETGSATGADQTQAIYADDSSNIIMLGFYQFNNANHFDSIQLNTGVQYNQLRGLAKFDYDGRIKWVRHFGSPNFSIIDCFKVVTDSKGGVYILGTMYLDGFGSVFRVGGVGDFTAQYNYHKLFLMKYTAAGAFKWLKISNGYDNEYARDFSITKDDELFVLSAFDGVSGFDSIAYTSMGGIDFAVSKFDTSGNLLWMNHLGGIQFDDAMSISCTDSSVMLVGQSLSNPCNFNQSDYTTVAPGNLFLAKLNKYELWPTGLPATEVVDYLLYPNPSKESCTLSIPPAKGMISIRDVTGKVLFSSTLVPEQTEYIFSTANLAKGVYVLQVQTTHGQQSKKLIIE